MKLITALSHIFFPHICPGCGTDVLDKKAVICVRCLYRLPFTNFNVYANNLTEKIFWGRLPVVNASSLCYFSKGSLTRQLMHQLKYKGNKKIGYYLGKMIGASLRTSERFNTIDALVPLPLFPAKERKRGYNQAAVLCEGMAEVMLLPVLKEAVKRVSFTDTQTRKNRIERWQNMEGRFELTGRPAINNLHVLLVDDIITTGATLEACGHELLQAEGTRLSIATLACSIN